MIGWIIFTLIMYVILNLLHYHYLCLWSKNRHSKWFRYKIQQVTTYAHENYYLLYRHLLFFPFLNYPIDCSAKLNLIIATKDIFIKDDIGYKKTIRVWLKRSQILAKVL